MTLRVASWNIEGRLSRFASADRRGSPEEIVEAIGRLQSDIVVLPEAYDGTKSIDSGVWRKIETLGYEPIDVSYGERADRGHQAVVDPHIMLLTKRTVVRHEERRLGDIRTIIIADIADPDTGLIVRIFGVHLDDKSEVNRLKQVEDLVLCVLESPFPVIVMGDFNAMYASDFRAKILRSGAIKFIVNYFPQARVRDMLQRLSGMATGDTMRYLEKSTELRDADSKSRATTTPKMRGQEWMPSIPLVQIDHMLVSPEIVVSSFAVGPDRGSDHRSISASIIVTRQNITPVL